MTDADFDAFVSASLPALLRFGHVLTGSPTSAEDLVQAALVRSWRARARIEDPHALVRRVMVNTNVSWWRRTARAAASETAPGPVVGADPTLQVDDRDQVWRALADLPVRQRTVIVLRYYEDLSEADIAEVMGTSTGTVKSQATRALRRLADLLEDPATATTTPIGGTRA